jgi:hypothetical protein
VAVATRSVVHGTRFENGNEINTLNIDIHTIR